MKNTACRITAVLMLTLFAFTSCSQSDCIKGLGRQINDSREVDDFTRINIAGIYKVTLRQDSSHTVKLVADSGLMKNIITTVSGGTLKIYNREPVCEAGNMELSIGVKNLQEIETAGAVSLQTEGKLTVKDIRLYFSGSTNATLALNADNVDTQGSGSTELNLSGQAASHKVNFNGNAKLAAFDFVSGAYNIISAGASNCDINVLRKLKIRTSGASNIQYKGNPADIDYKKSVASTLTKVQ